VEQFLVRLFAFEVGFHDLAVALGDIDGRVEVQFEIGDEEQETLGQRDALGQHSLLR
jgi:hypothetical protein